MSDLGGGKGGSGMKKLEGGFCATLFTVFMMDACGFSEAFFGKVGLIGWEVFATKN